MNGDRHTASFQTASYGTVTFSNRLYMKRFFLFIINIFFFNAQYAQTDSLTNSLGKLNEILKEAPRYDRAKEAEIYKLKQSVFKTENADLRRVFQIYNELYEAYKLFQYDSSYTYAKKLEAVSMQLGSEDLVNFVRIKLGFSLLSSGMYKETLDLLSTINTRGLSNNGKVEYYALMARYYYDLGDYDNDRYYTPDYNYLAAQYVDSTLALSDNNSYEYLYYDGLKKLKSGNKTGAKLNFDKLLARPVLTLHQIAVTASTLSDLYIQNGENDKAIPLLIKAVIADVQSSTKETSAAFILSTLLNKKGDIKNASLCINRAFEDAVFYGARQRKVQVSAILPLIEAQRFSVIEAQKASLIWYAALVTFLLLLVIILAIIVFKQVKKLQATQKALIEAHQKTQVINKHLSETNEKLNDANKIKEEYLGYFFNVNSEFFDKIERFKKLVKEKISDRKIDEIRFLVNNINLKREKEDLLKNFDRAFLKLFPTFVEEFNELFKQEDRINLKTGELLNTDLRIFGLARMGIHENEKVAHILQYSVHTINTYKTRIKNKSIVPNEEFEKRIMKIGIVNTAF
ncbi:MAG: DUF6377 domain-containing protein [Bacteroidota bacterium]|nr:DUF6377 domain-containing protein [Bacteroidota bacterium]